MPEKACRKEIFPKIVTSSLKSYICDVTRWKLHFYIKEKRLKSQNSVFFRWFYHKIRTQKAVTKAWGGGTSDASTHSVIISKLARFSGKAFSLLLLPPRTIPVPAITVPQPRKVKPPFICLLLLKIYWRFFVYKLLFGNNFSQLNNHKISSCFMVNTKKLCVF